jgi:uncharacterized damage-inducible protein DinB
MTTATHTQERADLLESLGQHRYFLRFTVNGLTDEQAAQRPTASALCLGGLIKHVTDTEEQWARFAVGGAPAMMAENSTEVEYAAGFDMTPSDTLEAILERYEAVAARTDDLVGTLDLDSSFRLPDAPWFPPGASWSVRRVLLHVIAETAQHAGHADIIRESIDGSRTMG